MVRFRRSMVLCAASAMVASAQTVEAQRATAETQRATAGPASRALLTLENSWATALIARDGATFRRLLAPGFVYTENDVLATRADVLRDVLSGTDTVTAAHNEGMEVHLFRPTGIVTGWLIVNGRGNRGLFEHRYRFTDTWLERNGTWQIVAAQDYINPVE